MSMGYKLSKSKRIQAAVVLAIAALLVMTGTFAWYSFTQRRINTFHITSAPNVNLHDDFAGGPEKDVYVENSGEQPALVRVRLTELMIRDGVILPDGAEDDKAGTNWHPHTPSESDCAVCNFPAHEYFKWTMSGHKFYMPAPDSAKGNDTTEPKDVGDLDAIIDYAALLRNAFADDSTLLSYIDAYLGGRYENAEELQTAIADLDNSYTVNGVRQYDGQPDDELVRKLNEVRLTLIPTQIITMQDWIDGTTYSEPFKTGNFWVMDEDGWCYWANMLNSGEATGQLLSNVENIKNHSGELTYRINVVLNATTFDGAELDDFFLEAAANGGISDNAKMLMHLVKGVSISVGETFSLNVNGEMDEDGAEYTVESVTFGKDGVAYVGVGGNLYFASVDENGNPDRNGVRYAIANAGGDGKFGTEDDIGPVRADGNYPQWYFIDIVPVTDGDVIESGQKGTLIRADSEDDAPVQTFDVEQTVYRVQAITRGENGLLYLKLDEDLYAVALDKAGEPVNLTMSEAQGGEPLPATYYIVFPSESGKIGTDGDVFEKGEPDFADGDGSAATPFTISTKQHLIKLQELVNTGTNYATGKHFKLTANINLGGDSWTPIGQSAGGKQFTGTFDGGSYTISGLNVNADANGAGLFGYVGSGGIVKALKISGVSFTNPVARDYIGAIAGYSVGKLENCQILGAVEIWGNNFIGGVAGYNGGTIENCHVANGEVNGNDYVGGIVGWSEGTTTGCSNNSNVSGSGDDVGGVAGTLLSGAELMKSYNTGTVEGQNNVGGVVGSLVQGADLSQCYHNNTTAEYSVYGSGYNVGGVVGTNNDEIYNCYAWGSVYGESAVGGVAGYNDICGITNAYHAFGEIEGEMQYVGGIVGENDGYPENCVALADGVYGMSMVGKVAGSGYPSNCYANNWMEKDPAYGGENGTAVSDWESFGWWTGTVNFSGSIWRWDSVNEVPVLIGVTP